jgi:CO/xanthine dehydrogenase FAD-binding subunit
MIKGYCKPSTIAETLSIMKRYGSKAKLMAGGTDVMVNYNRGKLDFEQLISINGLPELQGIAVTEEDFIRIGANMTLSDIENDDTILTYAPILNEAASQVGSCAIRNRATIGGNLCNASPAGDIAPALMVMDAELELRGANGSRYLPIKEFFLGPAKTVAQEDEILVAVYIPQKKMHKCKFIKLGIRKSMEIAIVSVACVMSVNNDGKCDYARLALGAVAPTPILISTFAKRFEGRHLSDLSESDINQVAVDAAKLCSPISDIRASKEYRKKAAAILSERAIKCVLTEMEAMVWNSKSN